MPASSDGRTAAAYRRDDAAVGSSTADSSASPPSQSLCSRSPGGLSLWLVVWLVLGKPSPASACPHLCVCYPTPMTVSCQAQNFTAVPVGVPYESQRVFLQNNRITELRVGSFGFGTQVRRKCAPVFVVTSRLCGSQSQPSNAPVYFLAPGSVAVLQQHHVDRSRGLQ